MPDRTVHLQLLLQVFSPVCCAASTNMTVFVLPSGPKVHTSFCTATLLVGGRRPLGGWHTPNCCCGGGDKEMLRLKIRRDDFW